MMYPRLKILHKLLNDSGTLCISIDDNSLGYLKLICEEIFGKDKLLGAFVWKRRVGSSLSSSWVSADHEYVLVYSKNPTLAFVLGDAKDMDKYNLIDENGKKFASMPLTVGMTKEMRPNQWYALKHPTSGNEYWPTKGRVWCYYPPTMKQKIIEKKILWPEDDPNRKRTTPRLKSYPEDAQNDRKPLSTWIFEKNFKLKKTENDTFSIKSGKNQEGAKILKSIFGEAVFNFSKPVSLIQRLIEQFCPPNGIILDSFAGSGTTAHAALSVNKKDIGNRKFILIEMEDYADNITAERVKRVIKGYGEGNKLVKGTGGTFDYYELGKPLFLEDNMLNEEVGVEKIQEYIWYSETRTPISTEQKNEEGYYLGDKEGTSYYFVYEKEKLTTLDFEFLSTIQSKAEQYIIYADNCLLSQEFMMEHNIVFKKIPRDITRF